MSKKILVQLNGPDLAEGILPLVTHLARNRNSVLGLLPGDDPVVNQASVGYWNEQPGELEAVSTRLTTTDLKPEVRVAVETSRASIVEASEFNSCDLNPTETHDRTGSGRGCSIARRTTCQGAITGRSGKDSPLFTSVRRRRGVGGAENTLGKTRNGLAIIVGNAQVYGRGISTNKIIDPKMGRIVAFEPAEGIFALAALKITNRTITDARRTVLRERAESFAQPHLRAQFDSATR